MMDARTRTNAKDYEAVLRHGIARKGHEPTAEFMTISRSRLTHWLGGDEIIVKLSLLLEFIEFEYHAPVVTFSGEDTTELAKGLIEMLAHIREPKEKARRQPRRFN